MRRVLLVCGMLTAARAVQAVLDIAFGDGAARVLKKPGAGSNAGGEGVGRSTTGGGVARANRPASARRYR